MVPNWCSFLSQLANLFFWYYSLVMASIQKERDQHHVMAEFVGPLRWRSGLWDGGVFEPTNVGKHPPTVTKVYGRWIYKVQLQAEQIRQQHARRWRLQWPFEKGRERKWRFGMDKGCQGWFQGHPIMVPLYGKFPVLYGNSMENLPNKGVPLLGVPDNPTELESQECCWSTLDLVKIHPC